MAADCPLGLAIVSRASTRGLKITAVAGDPARWPARQLPVEVVRGDLLDLTCPERLIAGSEVLVVPFGSAETGPVDFSTDLLAAVALCRASERVHATTLLVLAGRAPFTSRERRNDASGPRLVEEEAGRLAEHAAVAMYAAHVHLPWVYISPSGIQYTSEIPERSCGDLRALRRHSAPAGTASTAAYVESIVDVVERSGRDPREPGSALSPVVGPVSGLLPAGSTARRRE
jgi:putative NADH-flavin reductase